jgi:hypothetical protein
VQNRCRKQRKDCPGGHGRKTMRMPARQSPYLRSGEEEPRRSSSFYLFGLQGRHGASRATMAVSPLARDRNVGVVLAILSAAVLHMGGFGACLGSRSLWRP